MELSNSTLEALPQNYAEQVIQLPVSELNFVAIDYFVWICQIPLHHAHSQSHYTPRLCAHTLLFAY